MMMFFKSGLKFDVVWCNVSQDQEARQHWGICIREGPSCKYQERGWWHLCHFRDGRHQTIDWGNNVVVQRMFLGKWQLDILEHECGGRIYSAPFCYRKRSWNTEVYFFFNLPESVIEVPNMNAGKNFWVHSSIWEHFI